MLTAFDYSVIAIYLAGVIAFGIRSGGAANQPHRLFSGGEGPAVVGGLFFDCSYGDQHADRNWCACGLVRRGHDIFSIDIWIFNRSHIGQCPFYCRVIWKGGFTTAYAYLEGALREIRPGVGLGNFSDHSACWQTE